MMTDDDIQVPFADAESHRLVFHFRHNNGIATSNNNIITHKIEPVGIKEY